MKLSLFFFVLFFLVELGIKSDSSSSKGRQLSVYQEFFEEDFIKDTETFYAKESASFLANNPFTEYLKKVSQYISTVVINKCFYCLYCVKEQVLRLF